MLYASTGFVASSITIYHNVVKSLLFSAADLLLSIAVYMFFSLFAAKTKLFTSYLLFSEGYIQKSLFIASRGFSRDSFLVLGFALLYTIARLYGNLLWGLDAPGYILQGRNVSALSLNTSLLQSPAYIVSLEAEQNSLSTLEKDLPRLIGTNLFQPTVNFTLSGAVRRGKVETVNPTRPPTEVGARIWLDDQGFSVSPDTYVTLSERTDEAGNISLILDCPTYLLTGHARKWNCTFNNTFAPTLILGNVGLPEIHWDDATDKVFDSRYVRPDRMKNVWAAFGQGGGTAMMKQMFTVTKGTRRHTFMETTFRGTMIAKPINPFSPDEVLDFVKRTWSTNTTEQQAHLVTGIYNSIITAQTLNQSFMFGVSDGTDLTTTQAAWDYLTYEVDKVPTYSMLRISSTNITLIRSETIPKAPIPFEDCDLSFQNVAYGGKVVDTDCASAFQANNTTPHFMGQVDTSAFLLMYGLGDGRSNISSRALNQKVWKWSLEKSEYIDDLLISRGFIVSIDPSLVTLEAITLTPALSYLQVTLCVLTLFSAGVAWLCITVFATMPWSSSFLEIVLDATAASDVKKTQTPWYKPWHRWHWRPIPDIRLKDPKLSDEVLIGAERLTLDKTMPGGTVSYVANNPGDPELADKVVGRTFSVHPSTLF